MFLATMENLILHGLRALRDSLAQDKELTSLNTSIAVVGKDMPFRLIENDDVSEWLVKLGETSLSAYRQSERAAATAVATTAAAPTSTGSGATGSAGDVMETD